MKDSTTSSAFLTYWFEICPEKIHKFQVWATERGMPFWEQHRGVIQYRTFRQRCEPKLQAALMGIPAKAHGLSQVELEDTETLKRIIFTAEFQLLQNEFLQLVVPGSLKYSFLECVYDSSSLLTETMISAKP